MESSSTTPTKPKFQTREVTLPTELWETLDREVALRNEPTCLPGLIHAEMLIAGLAGLRTK